MARKTTKKTIFTFKQSDTIAGIDGVSRMLKKLSRPQKRAIEPKYWSVQCELVPPIKGKEDAVGGTWLWYQRKRRAAGAGGLANYVSYRYVLALRVRPASDAALIVSRGLFALLTSADYGMSQAYSYDVTAHRRVQTCLGLGHDDSGYNYRHIAQRLRDLPGDTGLRWSVPVLAGVLEHPELAARGRTLREHWLPEIGEKQRIALDWYLERDCE